MNNLNLVLPEIFISLSAMFLLILGVFKKNSSQLTFNLSLVTILVAIILTVNETFSVNRITIFNDSIVIDRMASLMKIITLIGGFLVLGISSNYLKTFKISLAFKDLFKPSLPVAQNIQSIGQPTWLERQAVSLFSVGIPTHSILSLSSVESNNFKVPSLAKFLS